MGHKSNKQWYHISSFTSSPFKARYTSEIKRHTIGYYRDLSLVKYHILLFSLPYHQQNMSVKYKPPHTPPLYRKSGVSRGISIFLIFAPKHRLWVLVRTASARGVLLVPTIYVLGKNKKKILKRFTDFMFYNFGKI